MQDFTTADAACLSSYLVAPCISVAASDSRQRANKLDLWLPYLTLFRGISLQFQPQPFNEYGKSFVSTLSLPQIHLPSCYLPGVCDN